VELPVGSTSWWRNGGGRFQVLYESSHFTNAGFTSGYIDKLLFRGEDGQPNSGGQTWAGVTVRVATTTLTPATLGTNFAANLATATATPLTVTLPALAVRRSAGSFPNNYNIEVSLVAQGGYFYTASGGNLLIDVTLPNAANLTATSGPVMDIQDTSGGASVVRGRGLTTATSSATTGTLSSAPPVVGFAITGSGGAAPVVPATNETFGAACGGSPSAFYQTFRAGQAFDLDGIRMTPDNLSLPTRYTVTADAGAFDASKVNAVPNSVADDAVVAHALGFPLRFPGGSTSSIVATTNGHVWLDGSSASTDTYPSVFSFLGGTAVARLAPLWMDLHAGRNAALNAASGLHVRTDTSGGPGNAVAYITWLDVGVFNSSATAGHCSYSFQVAIFQATGVIEFRYGVMSPYLPSIISGGLDRVALVGFSRGLIGGVPSADPQSRDLSLEAPFTTSVEGASGNIGQLVKATPNAGGGLYGGRAFAGQTLTFDAVGVPAGAILGVQLLDIVENTPGLFVPTITAPGCVLSTSLNPTLFQVSLFPPATVVGTAPVAIPAGIEGFQLVAQYAVLDGLLGGPNLMTSASNAVRVTVGKR
jgi:hypothetical protein